MLTRKLLEEPVRRSSSRQNADEPIAGTENVSYNLLMVEFESLKKYFSGFLEIPPLEWLYLLKFLSLKTLKKDSFFYRQGDTVNEVGFIVRGLCMNFYLDEKGRRSVKAFIHEGHPLAAYSSLLQGVVADFNCQAIEDTLYIAINYENLKALYDRHKCWERLGRISAEKQFIQKELREREFLMLDAKGRYESFLQHKAAIVGRIPQYLIASYLGVSEVSLSRLRKKR